MEIFAGFTKAVLEKYADPLFKSVKGKAVEEWEKFKIDFNFAFEKYIINSYEKYSKIKTILYKTEPKFIYDFFEIPFLEKENSCLIKAENVNDILSVSKFIIIQGMGGIGKSTLMKHLFINEISSGELIPVFVELKDINDFENDFEIYDLIFEKISNLGVSFDMKYLDYALKSGCFLFLLDGYDEISTSKKDYFFKKLNSFCDKYSENYYIISSRPYSEFIEFQRFTILKTCSFSKEQALSLVSKIDFDKDIKDRFIIELDKKLYSEYHSFASNPLLLNIMLLTYDNYAEIPEKLHLFYSNAFETLYFKHDATKAGFKRELKSKLSYDIFRKIFSYFCFISYFQNKLEFSRDDLLNVFSKIPIVNDSFRFDDYLEDLINSICVLYKDGLNYKFTHRSFQEYFTAVFLKELSDKSMSEIAIETIKKDIAKSVDDSVFSMLYDMAEDRFEQNVLLPILTEYEKECKTDNKYEFYLSKLSPEIKYSWDPNVKKKGLWMKRSYSFSLLDFIHEHTRYYAYSIMQVSFPQEDGAAKDLYNYLTQNNNYTIGQYISVLEISTDPQAYSYFKKTWLGEFISILSNLSSILREKKDKTELDLSNLLI